MKKILLGIALQIGVLNMTLGQQINALELQEGSSKSVHALSNIDSIVHTTDSLIIHKGNQKSWYGQIGLDSAKYVSLNSSSLPCGFGGYTGQYGTMTDARDGNVYKTVTIGNQRWMAENLRYDVPGVYGASDTINPNNLCRSYGRLYRWATVMNGSGSSSTSPSGVQGICPSGWHVPSDGEWTTLGNAIGGNAPGTAVKSMSGWTNNGNGSNASGFSAFPAGLYMRSFRNLLGFAYFWSSTEVSASNAWFRSLGSGSAKLNRYYMDKYYGNSCRCVEN